MTMDDASQEFTLADGKLSGEIGGTPVVMGRERPEVFSVDFADVKADAQAEEFDGTWNCAYLNTMDMLMPIDAVIASGQMTEAPVLTVDGGKIGLVGGGMDAMLGDTAFELTWAEYKYEYILELGETSLSMELIMLQDGMLKLAMDVGITVEMYFTKAE